VHLDLNVRDFSIIEQYLPYFEKAGFVIRPIGGNSIILDAFPAVARTSDPEKLLIETIDLIIQKVDPGLDQQEIFAKSLACSMAIKANTNLTQEEMQTLVNELFNAETPFTCPHGRPTIIKIDLIELERRFKRR
jgi:DNA mismatch repair protein MutL